MGVPEPSIVEITNVLILQRDGFITVVPPHENAKSDGLHHNSTLAATATTKALTTIGPCKITTAKLLTK